MIRHKQEVSETAGGSSGSACELVDACEKLSVAGHPFFLDLASRPVDLQAVWLLMANLREGISGHFVRWLAHTIERLEDQRIASLLAKQLNDELGNGDSRNIHSVLLDRFIAGLSPWCPPDAEHRGLLRAGRELAESGRHPFMAVNPYQAIGALMVGEIFAKKMDKCLGDEIRRQNWIPQEALIWLTIHETLEVDHADDALEIAGLIPDEQLQAAWEGGEHQWNVLWRFITEVQHAVESCGERQ
jgi:hypothetical protein